MSPALILALIVFLPVAILLALRINATLVFLSLCLGDVLTQFVGKDASSFFAFLANNNVTAQPLTASDRTLRLILLLFPVALTTVFMIRTVRGLPRLLLNILPAVGVGIVGA